MAFDREKSIIELEELRQTAIKFEAAYQPPTTTAREELDRLGFADQSQRLGAHERQVKNTIDSVSAAPKASDKLLSETIAMLMTKLQISPLSDEEHEKVVESAKKLFGSLNKLMEQSVPAVQATVPNVYRETVNTVFKHLERANSEDALIKLGADMASVAPSIDTACSITKKTTDVYNHQSDDPNISKEIAAQTQQAVDNLPKDKSWNGVKWGLAALASVALIVIGCTTLGLGAVLTGIAALVYTGIKSLSSGGSSGDLDKELDKINEQARQRNRP